VFTVQRLQALGWYKQSLMRCRSSLFYCPTSLFLSTGNLIEIARKIIDIDPIDGLIPAQNREDFPPPSQPLSPLPGLCAKPDAAGA
jgi:hypothetical protein